MKCVDGQCVCGQAPCPGSQRCCDGVCKDACTPPPPDMALPACNCPSHCVLSKTCVGNGCCFEDQLVDPQKCADKTPCAKVQYP
jgi:hypothetical protein